MNNPSVTAVTAGLLLLIQTAPAFAVSGNRGKCAAFVLARLFHAAGLSRQNTNNPLRLIAGLGTELIGFVLARALVWPGLHHVGGVQP